MKKSIAKELSEIANTLPLKFIEETEMWPMSGADLNLSGYGEHRKFDKDKYYEVPMPLFRAVEHKQQLKDALKKYGLKGVREYVQKASA